MSRPICYCFKTSKRKLVKTKNISRNTPQFQAVVTERCLKIYQKDEKILEKLKR